MLRVTNCRGLDDRVQLLVPHNSIHHSLPQSRSLLDGRRRQNLRRQQIGHTSMSIFSTCLRHSHWMPPLPTSRKYAPSVPARGCQSFWLPLVVIAGKRTNLQPVTFTCSHSQIIPQYIRNAITILADFKAELCPVYLCPDSRHLFVSLRSRNVTFNSSYTMFNMQYSMVLHLLLNLYW